MFDDLLLLAGRAQMRLSGGVVTDENRYPIDLCIDAVHAARAFYLGERLKERFHVPVEYYQEICLPIECKEIMYGTKGSGVNETFVTIPNLVGGLGKKAIRFIGSIAGGESFDLNLNGTLDCLDAHPFVPKSSTPRASYFPGKLTLDNLPTAGMEYLKIQAVFANPSHKLIEKAMLDKPKANYPLTADDAQIVEDLVVRRFFDSILRVKPDLSNDAVPNT